MHRIKVGGRWGDCRVEKVEEVEITTDAATFVIDFIDVIAVVVKDEVNDGVLLLQLYFMLCQTLL